MGGWTEFARKIEQAGAHALELNIYYIPTDMQMSGAQVEQTYLDILQAVKAVVKIPVCSTGSTSRISTWKRSRSRRTCC